MQNKQTDNLLKTINKFLHEENENCENPVTITQLLGYLIHRVNYVTDKKSVGIGMDICKQQHTRKHDFAIKDVVALMHGRPHTYKSSDTCFESLPCEQIQMTSL